MSTRKRVKANQNLYKRIWKLSSAALKRLMNWLLRSLLVMGRRARLSRSGFVLPTTVLLLLVVSLVIGALMARTSDRTNQVIGERQGKVISNAASPAIDRAKAKLEYLFNGDSSLPNGVPGQGRLVSLMRDDGKYLLVDAIPGPSRDDETRLHLNGLDSNNDGQGDNAWSYRADTDGNPQTGRADGTDATIAYSIIGQIPANQNDLFDQSVGAISNRARNLLVRNGPVNSTQPSSAACQQRQQNQANNAQPEEGWFVSNGNTASLRKNFQVNAVVIPDNSESRTVATLELQQDRQLDRGNKWGAWFRNDIELNRPPVFNWNGAMHTEGSIFVGENDNFTAYLLSSPSSCVFSRTASEITVAELANNQNEVQFQGQIVNGTLGLNRMLNNTNRFHSLDQNNQPIYGGTDTRTYINQDRDSVSNSSTPSNIALDPVKIFTEDKSEANGITNWATVRDSNWKNRDLVSNRRIYNQREPKPYVDDTYRADNRYGPKPTYSRDNTLGIPAGQRIGDSIPSTQPNQVLVSNDPLGNNTENLGLDGYWERRARREGLRVIVGQRLELGNPLGQPTTAISHQARQRRALRDNLAAVQATAIYHQANRDAVGVGGEVRNLPVACLATTAHPGTAATINNSTRFNNISVNGTSRLNTDFLTGSGTNGWEFNPPAGATTEAEFINAITAGQPLRIALTNLAHLAGDPFGAFPARQDTRDGNNANDAVPSVGPVVHPHPTLTAWGNFSDLRRVVNLLDSGTTTYADLSIADQSTLHTASCTLGMLAYKIQTLQVYDYGNSTNRAAISSDTVANDLDDALRVLSDGTRDNGEVRFYPTEDLDNDGVYDPGEDLDGNGTLNPSIQNITVFRHGSNTPISRRIVGSPERPLLEEYLLGLRHLAATLQPNWSLAESIHLKEQVKRDRRFGFAPVPTALPAASKYRYTVAGLTATYNYSGRNYNNGDVIQLGFDFTTATGNNYFGFGPPTSVDPTQLQLQVQRFIRLATTLSPTQPQPKFSSLFYLFPVANHNHNGAASATALLADPVLANQPQPANEYISNTYIFNTSVTDDVNNSYTYKVLQDNDYINDIENGPEDGIGAIALQPRPLANWQLPNLTVPNLTTRPNTITERITNATSDTYRAIPFLDKGMFNGREMMNVRVLDFDLDLLRRNALNIDPANPDDNWLPQRGIIYAFREDAVREDGIARPTTTTWENCNTSAEITTNTCRMNASTPQDPPINSTNGIATKPVDFLPEPDRRPYGFRLRNGANLTRTTLPLDDINNGRGMSFISDNPVYIQGDFNLHSRDGTTSTLLEEFTEVLDTTTYNNFYTRSSQENRFAAPGTDTWRSTEIIADAVTIISNNFCDGSIADSFTTAGTGSTAQVPLAQYNCGNVNGQTSYLNQNRPSTSSVSAWRRENPSDSGSPIVIDANGRPVRDSGPYSDSYYAFSDLKPLIDPTATRVNAILVSSVVPSRANQFNGGLHNFPRFLEDWNSETTLQVAGALIQLNFSTYATAPFDHDALEPGDTTVAGEVYRYYTPPKRLWGYDVGLQMSPAGPVARRFVTANNTRSEFYRELPVEDPYIQNLRCARPVGSQTRIDPGITCP